MGSISITPEKYQKVARISLFLLAFIIVTGAAVRLSGSGLGRSDWPTCENDQLVAEVDDVHAMVRTPRRIDLIILSLGPVLGVVVQSIVGALVVKEHLPPNLVIAHFLISMLLVWNAVELDYRSSLTFKQVKRLARGSLEKLSDLLVLCATIVLVTGTIVTGSGPHSGAESQQTKEALEIDSATANLSASDLEVDRLPFDVPDVTRVHGISMILFLLIMLLILLRIKRDRPTSLPQAQNLLVAIIAQAAIGYIQYFSDVPALLVGFHVAGATLIWILTLRLRLSIHLPKKINLPLSKV